MNSKLSEFKDVDVQASRTTSPVQSPREGTFKHSPKKDLYLFVEKCSKCLNVCVEVIRSPTSTYQQPAPEIKMNRNLGFGGFFFWGTEVEVVLKFQASNTGSDMDWGQILFARTAGRHMMMMV